ncbi:hypothetical protein GCM10028801_14090 [Nocardioides maradonensis]
MNAPRPAQVTLAMALIVGGAVLVIATAWERIGGLHSIEMQQQLAAVVEQERFSGLTVSSLATVLRVLCLVGAGAAAAAAVLAGQVPKRSRSARIALTVLAPLVVLGWFGTAGFYEPFLLVGIVLLWLSPTADWYVGREPAAREPSARERAVQPPVQTPPAPPLPPAPFEVPPPAQLPPPPGWAATPYPPLVRRPSSLATACVVTWVCSGLAAVATVAMMVFLTTSGDAYLSDAIDKAHQVWGSMADGITTTQLRAELYVLLAGVLLWCLAAIVLALFAWAGRGWARILLAVSAIGAGVCALVGALGSPILLVLAAACGVSAVLLLRPESSAWRR